MSKYIDFIPWVIINPLIILLFPYKLMNIDREYSFIVIIFSPIIVGFLWFLFRRYVFTYKI